MDLDLLKEQCGTLNEKLVIIESEINVISDGLRLLTYGVDSTALKNFLNSLIASCNHTSDVSIMEAISELVDLESGIQIYKEENTALTEGDFDTLVEFANNNNNNNNNEDTKPKRRYTRKKKEPTLDEIFGEADKAVENNEFMK